jgi:hypothetical protein
VWLRGREAFGVWIIHTDPSNDERTVYRFAGAQFVEVNPGRLVCLERLKNRPRVNQQIAREVIDGYFQKRVSRAESR